MNPGGLLDDGTDSTGTNDGPDEEGNAGGRDKIGFDGEEMADLVNWEPDGGERAEPEDEERRIPGRVGARVLGKCIWDLVRILQDSIVQSAYITQSVEIGGKSLTQDFQMDRIMIYTQCPPRYA